MLTSCHQKATQYHKIKRGGKFFEKVEKLKYLGKMTTNQNCIHEESKRRLQLGKVCYHSVKKFSFYYLEM
jgi:hypothetical protein